MWRSKSAAPLFQQYFQWSLRRVEYANYGRECNGCAAPRINTLLEEVTRALDELNASSRIVPVVGPLTR